MYVYVKEKPETYLLFFYFMLLVGVRSLFSVYRICRVTCLEDYNINSSQTGLALVWHGPVYC